MPLVFESKNIKTHIENVNDGGLYWQTTPPELRTVGYYFAQPNGEPLPGDPVFAVTNVTSTGLIAGFGQMSMFAGYAEQMLVNVPTNPVAPYAYLGQYFEPEAYEVGTTNSGGTVSPYGEFLATEPGPIALVTMPNYGENVQGTGIVQVVKLVLDVNHDGVIDLSATGPDNTTANTPYVFWENNNYDRNTKDKDDGVFYDDDVQSGSDYFTRDAAVPDCNFRNGAGGRAIPCARDLQDFARLWIAGMTTNLLANLPAGCTISLNWGDAGYPHPENPTIDLFQAADSDGGIGYLTNGTTAQDQSDFVISPYVGRIGPGSNLVLNASSFANSWAGNHFIWCGVSNGSGGLNLTIANSNGTVLAQTTAYIQIVDIKQMYERFTVGDQPKLPPMTNVGLSTEGLAPGEEGFEYPPPKDTNTTYILYVHGWNMEAWEKDRFAETAFKRLYWQGYHGRFGQFRWPTDFDFEASLIDAILQPHNYDTSEFKSWHSAEGLMSLLVGLNGEYPGHVYVLAHSMGNVVTGEALSLAAAYGEGQIVNTYVASQAAIPAHVYDASVTSPYLIDYSHSAHGIPAPGRIKTPNIYPNRLTNNVFAVGRRISRYNINDFALSPDSWCLDQALKPDQNVALGDGNIWDWGYNGSTNDPAPWNNFFRIYVGSQFDHSLDIVGSVDDFYEVLAYAADPYSTPLGTAPISTFTSVDMTDPANDIWLPDTSGHNYSDHLWHSAEFRGDCWQQWGYWNSLLFSPQFGFNIGN
ncbi:MAG TPA: hypothetical protein VH280_21850 [Verrucomicrobiae bacterium]|nr:hypothetical protein [Verrucomicrobiae bacterium]